jgi:DnaJ-like protein
VPEQQPDRNPRRRPRDPRTGRDAASARIEQQSTWVDQQIRVAMARGEFDDLPGAGKPIEDLGTQHDPDWWVKKLVEREQITGVLPASLQLRKDDAELDARLDALTTETEVRRELEDFNERVIAARYRLPEGPPLITMPRDVDAELERWRDRRTARRAELAARLAREREQAPAPARRWWRRGRGKTRS